MALGKVYVFGPTFRAEKSKTRRHLTEFWMVEPEVAYMDLEGDMELAEDFLSFIVARVLERRRPELAALERDVEDLQARLEARKNIDRAKGRLMDDHGLAEQDAWRFLQQQAMANRVKIDEIARRVVDGELTP